MLNSEIIPAGPNFLELKPLRRCKSDENLQSQCDSHNPSSSSHIGGMKSCDYKTLYNPITINLTKTFKKEDDFTHFDTSHFSFSPEKQKVFDCEIGHARQNHSNTDYIYIAQTPSPSQQLESMKLEKT
jgi:hypothetical protein